jgi:hypothetical protein
MDKKPFVERLLEVENLTDELQDRDANWLLDWGIGKLDTLLSDISDPETAGLKVNRLMAVMRKINRIAGSYAEKNSVDLADELRALQQLCLVAFGQPTQPAEGSDPQAFEKNAVRLAGMTPRQVVEVLCLGCDTPGGTQNTAKNDGSSDEDLPSSPAPSP